MDLENPTSEKEDIEALIVDTSDSSNKENISTDNIQIEINIEIKDFKSLKTLVVLITNNNKLHPQTDNLEGEFTTVSSKKKKNKKDFSDQKEELIRATSYRKL